MRTFQAFVIILCLMAGSWLIQGHAFFWPDRYNPSQGVLLQGLSSQLLGAGLLAIAALGVMAKRQASKGDGRAASHDWQVRYFALIMGAIILISIAMATGERMANPDTAPNVQAAPNSPGAQHRPQPPPQPQLQSQPQPRGDAG